MVTAMLATISARLPPVRLLDVDRRCQHVEVVAGHPVDGICHGTLQRQTEAHLPHYTGEFLSEGILHLSTDHLHCLQQA
jgi:hypothetical protein